MLLLDGVHKSFGPARARVAALDGLDLHVRRGEILGLLGPNGAGKTTTIGIAVGLLHPDRGRVTLGEAGTPADAAIRRTVGIAPQEIALYDAMTARENLEFFGRLHGLRRSDARHRANTLLERVGLDGRADTGVGGFSGGMKRRLNLAAALVASPKLVLLDEPTAGVDPQSRNAIFEIIAELRDEGVTVLFSTHYMEEASRLCDRVAIIDNGRILALGTVDELVAEHGGPSVVVVQHAGEARERRVETTTPLDEVARVLTLQPAGGEELGDPSAGATPGRVEALRIEPPDLESVFLALTGRGHRD
ncbi:MAG: ABC transporter ATP-binding protein [Planctomycetota bacterium]